MTDNYIITFDEAVCASIKEENRELDALVNGHTKPRAEKLRRRDRRDCFGGRVLALLVLALLWVTLALLSAILTARGFLAVSTGVFNCLISVGMAVLNLRLLGARKRGGKR